MESGLWTATASGVGSPEVTPTTFTGGHMLGKPLWIAAAAVAAAAFAAAPALADQVFHTSHAAVHAVAGAPLQSGFVNDIHSNGTVNSAHEEYHLNGAQPNTTYQVRLAVFPTTDCTGLPFLF